MGPFGQVLSNRGVITNWSILPKEQEVVALHQAPQPWCSAGRSSPMPPCPHSPTPILETKRVYDLEHWRTMGNGESTLRDHGHRIACSLSQHRVSRLQSVWYSGQHLETMPSIGWGSQPTELQTGVSPQPIPPPTHTQTHREKPKLGSSQSFSSAPPPCDSSPG